MTLANSTAINFCVSQTVSSATRTSIPSSPACRVKIRNSAVLLRIWSLLFSFSWPAPYSDFSSVLDGKPVDGFQGEDVCHRAEVDGHSLRLNLSKRRKNCTHPFFVSRYCWSRLLGLSGMVYWIVILLQRGSKVIIREMHAVFECERVHELGTGHITDQNLQQPTDLPGDLRGDLPGVTVHQPIPPPLNRPPSMPPDAPAGVP